MDNEIANHDPAAYWKVAEGVQLTRYRSTNVTRLIAVRKGRNGNDDVIFEIFINRKTKKATIKRDDTVLFTIGVDGLSSGRLQTAAISVLRSYLRQNDHSHKVSAMIRSRLAEERKAAVENAASDECSHE